MIVRIRNFQSIKDATIEISGFTVITGPNNSGKTAALRAIRGLFTNAAPGPFIRTGEASFIVDVTFDDSQTITWEKGWEKPDRKGGSINRYTVNGKVLSGVGRGVPPEVEAFLVKDISAGSDRLWPQIARQFDGTLFLVDRPGSVMAEALSDVERVGKLSDALRLSESDKRGVINELKIRREDLTTSTRSLEKYRGLDDVLSSVADLSALEEEVESRSQDFDEALSLKSRRDKAFESARFFDGFEGIALPSSSEAVSFARKLEELERLFEKHSRARTEAQRFSGFNVSVPELLVQSTREQYLAARICLDKLKTVLAQQLPDGDLPVVPDCSRTLKLQEASATCLSFRERLTSARESLVELDRILKVRVSELAQQTSELGDALKLRGNCPTCGMLCESSHGTAELM